MKTELTKKELKELVGGKTLETHQNAETDVINTNKKDKCICTYNNLSTTTNANSVSTCQCICV